MKRRNGHASAAAGTDQVVAKFLDQGGDPAAAVLLRYALANAPPPPAARYILAHPDVKLVVDLGAQRLAALDGAGDELCTSRLDVDARSHLLRHVLERVGAASAADAHAVAKWALAPDSPAPLPVLELAAAGYIELRVRAGEVEARLTDGGTRLVRALNSASRNDRCPCGSGRKFKRCCERYVR